MHCRAREVKWRLHIEAKRRSENTTNEQRLIEAREKFIQSQNLLRKLIQDKEDRRREVMESSAVKIIGMLLLADIFDKSI